MSDSVLQGGHFKKIIGPLGFWKKGGGEAESLGKRRSQNRPEPVDMTGGSQSNADLLYGLFYGDEPGLQFAAPMAYAPISVPTNLVGIPTPRAPDEKTQEAMKEILKEQGDEFPIIVQTYLLIGTAWRWCRYSQKLGRVIWEAIPDQNVTDIEIDVDTGEISVVWDHVMVSYSDGYNRVKRAERKRRIGRDCVQVWWTGEGRELKSERFGNPFGFIPIPFGHECKEGEWRGHSIFGRNLRLFKSTHDIHRMRDEILAQFRPKLVQHVAGTADAADKWLANNAKTLEDMDPFQDDFYINVGDHEKTDFLHLPADATRQHTEAISANLKLLMVGSGVPELFWPGLATGNHASTDVQKDLGVEYIHGLRRELNRAFTQLFNQTLTLRGFMEQTRYGEARCEWDQFEMVSKETMGKIFSMFTQSLGRIINDASMGYDDVKYFIDKFYPDMPERTRDKIKAGMFEMLKSQTLHLKGDLYDAAEAKAAGGIGGEKKDAEHGDSSDGDGDDLDDGARDMEGAGSS